MASLKNVGASARGGMSYNREGGIFFQVRGLTCDFKAGLNPKLSEILRGLKKG